MWLSKIMLFAVYSHSDAPHPETDEQVNVFAWRSQSYWSASTIKFRTDGLFNNRFAVAVVRMQLLHQIQHNLHHLLFSCLLHRFKILPVESASCRTWKHVSLAYKLDSIWPSPVQDVEERSPVCSLYWRQHITECICPPLPPLLW